MKTIFLTFISLLTVLSSFSQSKEEIQLQLIDFFNNLRGSDRDPHCATEYDIEFNAGLVTVHKKDIEHYNRLQSEWNSKVEISVNHLLSVKFIKKNDKNYLRFKAMPEKKVEQITFNFMKQSLEEADIWISSDDLTDSLITDIEHKFKQLIYLYQSNEQKEK